MSQTPASAPLKVGRRELFAVIGLGAAGTVLLSYCRAPGDVIEHRGLLDQVFSSDGPSLGESAADVAVAVFTDYRCPGCRASHAPMLAAARDTETRLLFKDWPVLGALSERAARLALGAEPQGRYLAVHDALMRANWSDEAGILAQLAAAGADPDAARAQSDGASVTAQLQVNANLAFALGLRGTPSYLAGPVRVQGALDERGFTRLFERARREWRRLG